MCFLIGYLKSKNFFGLYIYAVSYIDLASKLLLLLLLLDGKELILTLALFETPEAPSLEEIIFKLF
jgi:hypothetical protein